MNNLNPFAISGLLTFLTSFPLSSLIFLKGKTKLTKIYSLQIFIVSLWGIGAFIIGICQNIHIASIIWKFTYSNVLFIPPLFLHTVTLLTKKSLSKLLFLSYLQSTIFAIITFSDNMFFEYKILFNSFYYGHGTILYLISFIIWLSIVSYSYFILIRYFQLSFPKQKIQIIYLLIAAILGFSGGSVNFLPALNINIYPYGNFLVPIYTLFITFAILKHQFFDIIIVIKRGIVYSVLITLISLSYLLLVVFLEKILQRFFGYKSIIISIVTAFSLGIIFVPLRNKIQYLIDYIFFKGTQSEIVQQNELLRQEVTHSEKLKSVATLASGIAHEIKNPLTALKTFSEYLPKRLEDKEFLIKFSRIAGNEVTRIDKLVHELLDFAKPAPPTLKETNINKLIDDTLNFLDSEFIKHNIKLSKDLNVTTTLKVDSNQLRQAFYESFHQCD